MTSLGIVGAGTMGSGIALVGLTSGLYVTLYDVNSSALDNAHAYLVKFLSKKDQLPALHWLTMIDSLDKLSACDVVIEAASEDIALKRDLFAKLSAICPAPAILATNTSTCAVTEIAAAAASPARVAGMHFFNPAPVLPLVEVIRAAQTDDATINTLIELAKTMGKTPVVAKDTPGFIVNRVARPFYLESLRVMQEGIATPHQIDTLLRTIGFKMGAFELMDIIGIDVSFAATRSIYEQTFHEPRYRPSLIQAKMVQAGTLGRKTGRGFYDYTGGKVGFVMPIIRAYDGDLMTDLMKLAGDTDTDHPEAANDARTRVEQWCASHRVFSPSAALAAPRIVCQLINEAVFAVMDGAADVETIDTAVQLGLNYPRGLFAWGKHLGFSAVIDVLDELHTLYAEERYRIAPLLFAFS